MKKKVSVILLLLFLFPLCACSSHNENTEQAVQLPNSLVAQKLPDNCVDIICDQDGFIVSYKELYSDMTYAAYQLEYNSKHAIVMRTITFQNQSDSYVTERSDNNGMPLSAKYYVDGEYDGRFEFDYKDGGDIFNYDLYEKYYDSKDRLYWYADYDNGELKYYEHYDENGNIDDRWENEF